jgi:hypothetical protein
MASRIGGFPLGLVDHLLNAKNAKRTKNAKKTKNQNVLFFAFFALKRLTLS